MSKTLSEMIDGVRAGEIRSVAVEEKARGVVVVTVEDLHGAPYRYQWTDDGLVPLGPALRQGKEFREQVPEYLEEEQP